MPKTSKTKLKPKTKPKLKQKGKATPEAPGITTSKTYWVALDGLMVVFVSVLGAVSGLSFGSVAALNVAVAVAVALVGYIRVTPSKLSLSKRATFLFAGTSLIGFGMWAIITLSASSTGTLLQLSQAIGGWVFIVTSLVTCLSLGAFAGELIGQNPSVQERLFPPKMD